MVPTLLHTLMCVMKHLNWNWNWNCVIVQL